jgi:3-isopropylmalate/(R)-2-methylmalate dehydratase large subunit
MTMDERMTMCNMSIEGGARLGYVNPDDTTIEYLRGRKFAPEGEAFDSRGELVARTGVRCGCAL